MKRRPDKRWLDGLLGPGEPEMSCEQCFAALDRYVELEHAASDADPAIAADPAVGADSRFPGMKAHLQGCPACREEHDLLLLLVDES